MFHNTCSMEHYVPEVIGEDKYRNDLSLWTLAVMLKKVDTSFEYWKTGEKKPGLSEDIHFLTCRSLSWLSLPLFPSYREWLCCSSSTRALGVHIQNWKFRICTCLKTLVVLNFSLIMHYSSSCSSYVLSPTILRKLSIPTEFKWQMNTLQPASDSTYQDLDCYFWWCEALPIACIS